MLEGNTSIPVLGPTCGLGGIVECLHPHAFGQDALSIHIRDAEFGIEIEANTFDQQVTEFVDHPLPVPCEIGRAFSVSAGRIGVGAHQAARTGTAQQMALVRLAYGYVRCARI